MIQLDNATVYWGSNLDILPTLPDNSVDSIVTDPPYELGFMGKSWDSSGIAYSVELWTECMRVLKPGGHLLAFGGSRTWHRLAVAIEDAGFEMRDSIAWLYGSGFPKSMDISKAIDKTAPRAGMFEAFANHFSECWDVSGLKRSNLFLYFPHYKNPESIMAQVSNWKLGKNVPSKQDFGILKPLLGLSDEFSSLIDRVEAEREVIGSKMSGIANKEEKNRHTIGASKSVEVDITAPATPEAIKWQGWGTALKPAFEPVVVARKPFKGTVASNVLEWGVGGLNIDGSRIGMSAEDASKSANNWKPQGYESKENIYDIGTKVIATEQSTQGRWPANIILDPYTAELLDEQSGVSTSKVGKPRGTEKKGLFANSEFNKVRQEHNDSGGASRFFYVAKASKRDRNEGLEGLPTKAAGSLNMRTDDHSVANGMDTKPAQNFHPTVKPTSLMEYLIKLVTPEGGTVLDPFTGSGSTGKAALLNGFQFIGIELTEEYLPIIEGRLKWANEQRTQQASQSEQEKKETLF